MLPQVDVNVRPEWYRDSAVTLTIVDEWFPQSMHDIALLLRSFLPTHEESARTPGRKTMSLYCPHRVEFVVREIVQAVQCRKVKWLIQEFGFISISNCTPFLESFSYLSTLEAAGLRLCVPVFTLIFDTVSWQSTLIFLYFIRSRPAFHRNTIALKPRFRGSL